MLGCDGALIAQVSLEMMVVAQENHFLSNVDVIVSIRRCYRSMRTHCLQLTGKSARYRQLFRSSSSVLGDRVR